ncbi:hypothetical protein DM860_015837 [Cuscuta australis]|uniref:Leucine-rich repeat-containing N-terminal plant-type domain-containing protein n=1 Tax=Cuscuta australis TaxID=267555 RepID=A0A328DZQ0_9ASTE|nr:hypothetical protein DM860_015837 [Cuscuta australis]
MVSHIPRKANIILHTLARTVETPAFHMDFISLRFSFIELLFVNDANNCTNNWDPNSADPCTWSGVTCNNDDPTVTQLSLVNCSFSGTLSSRLGNLINLEKLTLDQNGITGNIPEGLKNLKNLTDLDLQSNRLEGPIPDFLCYLPNLKNLFLSDNPLLGQAPQCLLDKQKQRQITTDFAFSPPSSVGSDSSSTPPISIGWMFVVTIAMCLVWLSSIQQTSN